ncbi:MAG: hypothetical protein KKC80_08655 [Candidatus Margulisbacteria bacterium]|nr:hypothetical protein [Candidatus Margulisiibacteriota bacterium]MBU1617086.1 hypothetical protein [Candidatus Margulisiibacteriota bacterium]
MKNNLLFVGLLALVLLAAGCGASKEVINNPVSSVEKYGYVNIGINWPDPPSVGASVSPSSAVKISITAQAAGYDAVATEIVYPNNTAAIEVAYNVSYDLLALAKNTAGQVVAIGEAKGIVLTETGSTPVSFFFHSVASTEPTTP